MYTYNEKYIELTFLEHTKLDLFLTICASCMRCAAFNQTPNTWSQKQ